MGFGVKDRGSRRDKDELPVKICISHSFEQICNTAYLLLILHSAMDLNCPWLTKCKFFVQIKLTKARITLIEIKVSAMYFVCSSNLLSEARKYGLPPAYEESAFLPLPPPPSSLLSGGLASPICPCPYTEPVLTLDAERLARVRGNVIFWRVRDAHYQDHSMMHFAKKSELSWLERVCWCGDQELGAWTHLYMYNGHNVI